MAVQSLANAEHMGGFWGDVLALFVGVAGLGLPTPRQSLPIRVLGKRTALAGK